MNRALKPEPNDPLMEDLQKNPHRYGLPTFEEFCKNPDRWRKRWDDVLAGADAGSRFLGKQVSKYIYEVEGTKCKSPEEAERVAIDKGFDLKRGAYRVEPELIDEGGQKGTLLVKIVRGDPTI